MMIIRHGQSEFNVLYGKTRVDPGIRDPRLTDFGRNQAREAAAVLRAHGIAEIIASPYWRTLETAEILAEALDVPIRINPLVGEHAAFTSDIGSPVTALRERWPHLDFTGLREEWWPDFIEEHHHVDGRSQEFRRTVRALEKFDHLLVVSHWGFIRALTGTEMPNCGIIRFDPHSDHPGGADIVHPLET